MSSKTDPDPKKYLAELSSKDDADIDLANASLVLGKVFQFDTNLEKYQNHLKKLTEDVKIAFDKLIEAGAEDDAHTRLASLKTALHDQHEYKGDRADYEHIQNANMMAVIDRRKGLPIALGVLYLHAGRAQGWDLDGLCMPAHFVCRIEHEGVRLIFDPFNACKILEAPDLRELIKHALGEDAELSADYYEPASNLEILMRLQNNIKFRLIEVEAYDDALNIVEAMRVLDPDETRLMLEAGVLYARTGKSEAAIKVLEYYMDVVGTQEERHEAALLLQQLRDSLNP